MHTSKLQSDAQNLYNTTNIAVAQVLIPKGNLRTVSFGSFDMSLDRYP